MSINITSAPESSDDLVIMKHLFECLQQEFPELFDPDTVVVFVEDEADRTGDQRPAKLGLDGDHQLQKTSATRH
ncbi:MAG: hypothetical protein IT340_05775 [Chloroflexi bacterium]|nr:hypothetical protein [Chloroflexota bacterium]